MSRWTARPGSWTQAVEVLEGVGEGAEAADLEEDAQAGLDAGCLAQLGAARSVRPELGRRRRSRRHSAATQLVDVGSGHRPDRGGEVAHAVAVDRHAETDLRLDLVALGVRDVAHVVAEPRHPEAVRLVPGAGRP